MCSIAETKAPGQGADGSVGLKPNAIWTSYKNGPLYHEMISLLLFFVTSKVLAGKAL